MEASLRCARPSTSFELVRKETALSAHGVELRMPEPDRAEGSNAGEVPVSSDA